MLNEVLYRGTPMPPTDPLVYRFYELVMVNGPAWKELIEEEFGDDIMSAINASPQLPVGQSSQFQVMLVPMPDEDHKRLRETVLAELERRRRLAREVEDRLAGQSHR